MAVEFKWIVLVKPRDDEKGHFLCSTRTQKEARDAATEYVKGRAPGTLAAVLETHEVITGKITVQTDAA